MRSATAFPLDSPSPCPTSAISAARPLWRRFFYAAPLLGLFCASSCALHQPRPERVAADEPQVRMQAVEAASLGTLDVLPLRQPADVDLPRRNQLIAGYVSKNLPLKMKVSLQAYNPNALATTLTGLAYTVLIDGKALGSGRLAMTVELPANEAVTLPLSFEMNTYKLLGEDALPSLRTFALGFGDPRRERLTLRVRPLLRAPRPRPSAPARPSALPLLTTTAPAAGTGR